MYFALIAKLFDSPAASVGIVYVHVLPLILLWSADRSFTWLGALSVTTAFLNTTLPVFLTTISYSHTPWYLPG